MSLTAEDIRAIEDHIKSHIGEWLTEQSLGKPPVVYEIVAAGADGAGRGGTQKSTGVDQDRPGANGQAVRGAHPPHGPLHGLVLYHHPERGRPRHRGAEIMALRLSTARPQERSKAAKQVERTSIRPPRRPPGSACRPQDSPPALNLVPENLGSDPTFTAGAFVPEPDPAAATVRLKEELDRLRAERKTFWVRRRRRGNMQKCRPALGKVPRRARGGRQRKSRFGLSSPRKQMSTRQRLSPSLLPCRRLPYKLRPRRNKRFLARLKRLLTNQKTAIEKVEEALGDDSREMLVAMATGTGKTKLAIALLYRLLTVSRWSQDLCRYFRPGGG